MQLIVENTSSRMYNYFIMHHMNGELYMFRKAILTMVSAVFVFSAFCNTAYADFFEEKYNFEYMELALTDGYIMIEVDKFEAVKPEIEKYSWDYSEFEALFQKNEGLKFIAPYIDGSFTIMCQINNNDTTRTIGDLNTSNIEVIKQYTENIQMLYTADGAVTTEEVRTEEGEQLVIKHMYSNLNEDKYGLVYATIKNGHEYILETVGQASGKKSMAVADLEQIFTGVVYYEDETASMASTAFVTLPGDPATLNRAMNRTLVISGISIGCIAVLTVAFVIVYKVKKKGEKKPDSSDAPNEVNAENGNDDKENHEI